MSDPFESLFDDLNLNPLERKSKFAPLLLELSGLDPSFAASDVKVGL